MSLQTRLLTSFADRDAVIWNHLLRSSSSRVVFLTHEWQRAWWDVFGRGKLLLIYVERDNQPLVIAPLFADEGMVFFVGSGGSDYLDFLGDISGADVLRTILAAARSHTPGFQGFKFYHVPDASRTGSLLQQVSATLGLVCYDEGELPAPALEFAAWPLQKRPPAEKQSLLRHERQLKQQGALEVYHFQDAEHIRPQLDDFFQQHIRRWASKETPSLFESQAQRRFYYHLTEECAAAGWLRFTRIDWQAHPIAYHFGTCFADRYLWYKPSFDISHAEHSPGEVLLRHLLIAAQAEHAQVFDFGLGDEQFKNRFATHTDWVRTWGLYPTESATRQVAL